MSLRPGGCLLAAALLGAHLCSPAAIAATYTVTTTNDSGAGSLRQAILDATDLAADTIVFNIAGPGVKTITPASDLPDIPGGTVIDGFSQPGSSPNSLPNGSNAVHLIEIRGPAGGGDGLRGAAPDVKILGLVINGFTGGYGIHAMPGNFFGWLIQGCHIGTDVAGAGAVPNGGGILIEGAGSTEIGVAFNLVSTLTTEGSRNVISGNQGDGIRFSGASSGSGIVQGNHIGVNAAGLAKLGNNGDGVEIFNAVAVQIGSGTPGPGLGVSNLIGGNAVTGVRITGGSSLASGLYGSQIGTDMGGTLNLGNSGAGVLVEGGVSNAAICQNIGQQGTRIAFNTGPGVLIVGAGTENFATAGCTIYGNTGLNIDVNNDGQTPNDTCDADSGPNALQNKPVLTSATLESDGKIHVTGSLETGVWGGPGSIAYDIYYFTAPSCNQANPGTQRYTGDIGSVGDPATCGNAFNHRLDMLTLNRAPGDDYLLAIAEVGRGTAVAGGSSEISNCIPLPSQATPGVNLNLQKTAAPDPATEDLPLVYTLLVTNNGQTNASGVTVSDPLPAGTTFLSGDSACSFSNGTQTVTCNYGSISANGSFTSHLFTVVPTGPGTVTNTATATSNATDDNPADNTDTAVTPVAMAVYDLEGTTTGGGFSCPPNPKKQICTLSDTLSFLNGAQAYFTGDLDITSTCKKLGTTKASCKISGGLQVNLFNVLGIPAHDITAYLSTDTTVDPGDTVLATAPTSLLAALAPKGKSVKIKYTHPKGQAYTGMHVLLVLDSQNAVSETDETNNALVIGSFP